MHVSEISFCDQIGFNIKNDDSKRSILQKLEEVYNLRIVAKHFEHFSERNMETINKNLHLICTRTNGNPYFLYLVKINFTNYCIFIDKKIQQGYFFPRMIIAHIFLDDKMFDKDIIFDGEMTKTKDGKWIYLINDLLIYKGDHLNDMGLVKRLNLCYKLLEESYKTTDTDIFKMMVKKYFSYDELDKMLTEFIPSRNYTCRGIYFRPMYLKFKDILVNFDDSLVCKVERVKYKNNYNNNALGTIRTNPINQSDGSTTSTSSSCSDLTSPVIGEQSNTFLVKKTHQPDVYELYKSNDSNTLVGIACIPNMRTSKKMREVFQSVNMVTKVSLTCEYSEQFKKWIPTFD